MCFRRFRMETQAYKGRNLRAWDGVAPQDAGS
jgi:hypothetical protein